VAERITISARAVRADLDVPRKLQSRELRVRDSFVAHTSALVFGLEVGPTARGLLLWWA